MKKYELTDETKEFNGKTLYRIRALIDFGFVKTGDFGGWIEKEENLSQEGRCWAYDNACIYGNAHVSGNAKVFGNANVFGNADVSGNACVFDNACVFGNACISSDAKVCNNARVCENM